MSTRATVHFHHGKAEQTEPPTAIVYRHSDGYPEGLGADLQRFFTAVQAHTQDTRFNDPAYLAAKFVVWQAGEYTHPDVDKYLAFLGVGVVLEDPSDIQFRYHVYCSGSVPEVVVDAI